MLSAIKKYIYKFITWTHILFYILPKLFQFLEKFIDPEKLCNHHIRDASGQTIRVTRWNGKNFPIVGTSKLNSISDINIRPDDILLCSYPKAGCHWLYEILFMLIHGHTKLTEAGKDFAGDIDVMPNIFLDSIPSPRILCSHLLYSELPKGVFSQKIKIIQLARNPKDTSVSFYNHHINSKHIHGFNGKFKDYFQLFMSNQLEFGNYFDYILEWDKAITDQQINPVLLVTYEDLKLNPIKIVHEITLFLNIFVSEAFINKIVAHCDFTRMKQKRKNGNKDSIFYRKGIVGDWRNWFSEEQSTAIDEVWQERMLHCQYQPVY